jgi:hypothetical protein
MGTLFNYPKPAAAMALMDYNPNLIPITSGLPVVTTALHADRKSVPT